LIRQVRGVPGGTWMGGGGGLRVDEGGMEGVSRTFDPAPIFAHRRNDFLYRTGYLSQVLLNAAADGLPTARTAAPYENVGSEASGSAPKRPAPWCRLFWETQAAPCPIFLHIWHGRVLTKNNFAPAAPLVRDGTRNSTQIHSNLTSARKIYCETHKFLHPFWLKSPSCGIGTPRIRLR